MVNFHVLNLNFSIEIEHLSFTELTAFDSKNYHC